MQIQTHPRPHTWYGTVIGWYTYTPLQPLFLPRAHTRHTPSIQYISLYSIRGNTAVCVCSCFLSIFRCCCCCNSFRHTSSLSRLFGGPHAYAGVARSTLDEFSDEFRSALYVAFIIGILLLWTVLLTASVLRKFQFNGNVWSTWFYSHASTARECGQHTRHRTNHNFCCRFWLACGTQ